MSDSAADRYAARVDAVIAQRTRIRGPEPPGDLFALLPAGHPLLKADPRRQVDPNLEVIASYLDPDDVVVDVGGGAGRVSLPLALRCRELIVVDPSAAMGAAFTVNSSLAAVTNARFIEANWLTVDPPEGTVALVNHVTYFTRAIVPFIEKLERSGRRRVLITVNSPPPPSWHQVLYKLVYGESEEIVPGHVELVNVLWELSILPDVRILPVPAPRPFTPAATSEEAIVGAIARLGGEQWALWSLGPELEERARYILKTRFNELFTKSSDGFVPCWVPPGRVVLITWEPTRGTPP